MRKGMFIVAAATAVCLTGCASVQTLTEDQNNAIAEYMADSLLKSDKNYTYKQSRPNRIYLLMVLLSDYTSIPNSDRPRALPDLRPNGTLFAGPKPC